MLFLVLQQLVNIKVKQIFLKFKTAFSIVTKKLPFTKFEKNVHHEKHAGVKVDEACKNSEKQVNLLTALEKP